jgi:hypothetical protein
VHSGSILDWSQENWHEALSQICPNLKVLDIGCLLRSPPNYLAPIVNAKHLTTLKLGMVPTSELFRQMANNYICLQNVELINGVDCSEYSDFAYFLEKQSKTLTSLTVYTGTQKPLIAISKCQNLKRLHLKGTSDIHGDQVLFNHFYYLGLTNVGLTQIGLVKHVLGRRCVVKAT